MIASEYIAKLQELIAEHGDLICVDTYDNQIGEPEECDGTFVLADKS